MSAARISKVRMTAGGAEVRILRRPERPEGGSFAGKIVAGALTVAGQQARDSELVGYVVIGVFSDGASSVGFGWDKLCPIPQSLAPQWIAELLRRDMITAPEIADTVNRANGFED